MGLMSNIKQRLMRLFLLGLIQQLQWILKLLLMRLRIKVIPVLKLMIQRIYLVQTQLNHQLEMINQKAPLLILLQTQTSNHHQHLQTKQIKTRQEHFQHQSKPQLLKIQTLNNLLLSRKIIPKHHNNSQQLLHQTQKHLKLQLIQTRHHQLHSSKILDLIQDLEITLETLQF